VTELEGKVALVTGASRGVGAATAVALAEAGCSVAVAARSTRDTPQKTPGTLDETIEKIEKYGARALAVPTNLINEDEVVAMVERTAAHFGRLDILVNNAAITFPGDLDIEKKRYDLTMNVDARAPMVAIRTAVPHLRSAGGGAICNISSVAALMPIPTLMVYGMAKAALEHLTINAAAQLAPGIRVNCFRIDLPVASEGFVANAPDLDHSTWEPSEVAAEGILWTLRQDFTGRLLSMNALREKQGIMRSRSERPHRGPQPPTRMMGEGTP
jgi:NAD(P)-dependent dehydrogenase (short-subunit alcohol dehydrogenase family)